MDANRQKFQSIVVGRTQHISFSFSFKENLIVFTDNTDVLGFTLVDYPQGWRSCNKHLY